MNVSQVAYDRFVVELPPRDTAWSALADPDLAAETAGWLWEFGPTPLVAIVGHDGAAPPWLASSWEPRIVTWAPNDATLATAVVLTEPNDVARFLAAGDPHDRTLILWPRRSVAKTFEALMTPRADFVPTVDAMARITGDGTRLEVVQVAT